MGQPGFVPTLLAPQLHPGALQHHGGAWLLGSGTLGPGEEGAPGPTARTASRASLAATKSSRERVSFPQDSSAPLLPLRPGPVLRALQATPVPVHMHRRGGRVPTQGSTAAKYQARGTASLKPLPGSSGPLGGWALHCHPLPLATPAATGALCPPQGPGETAGCAGRERDSDKRCWQLKRRWACGCAAPWAPAGPHWPGCREPWML